MTERICIDYCWENDDYVNLDSEDIDQDQLKELRNFLELLIRREGAYRNTWGEIYFDEDEEFTVTVYDRDPEDIIEQ